MKLRKQSEEFIKITIGKMKKNSTGYEKPTITINLDNTNMVEVHDKIMEKVVNG